MVWVACRGQPVVLSSHLSVEYLYIKPSITLIMVIIVSKRLLKNVLLAYLSFFEVISQVVEKFVKYFKPRQITEAKKSVDCVKLKLA